MSEASPSTGAAVVDPSDDKTPVVEFKDVTITFDVKPVLNHISFSVERGETLILLGPAGCGKSVLLKLANGLLGPDSGSIRIFGQEITTIDRKSTRLNSSHLGISYAVFCLKK